MNEKIDYAQYAAIFKAISDPKRLQILDMLSSADEICACKLQEAFNISQPTLSHDMKLLTAAGLVNGRKEGKWMQYSLNIDRMNDVYKTFGKIMVPKEYEGLLDCTCKDK